MPKQNLTTHEVVYRKLIIYRRAQSGAWQCRYKIGNSWQRATTKETDFEQAKAKAWDLLQEAEFRLRNNLPAITRRFRDVGELAVRRMEKELENKAGKVIYKDYIAVIRDYLMPFFGKHFIDKIKYDTLDDYDAWRTAKMGRIPSASTVHTHNAALSRIFDEAVARGFMAEIEKPTLDVTGRKIKRRPSFDDGEVLALVNHFDSWAERGLTQSSQEKRYLLRDYSIMLLDTGARAGKELLDLKWNQISTSTNPEFIGTGIMEEGDLGEVEEKKIFKLNRVVWMPVVGKTGYRTIVGFDRTYRALNAIAQRNYGKSAEELINAKMDEAVIRTAKKQLPTKFGVMFDAYLQEHQLQKDPKTGDKRVLYSLRHTYATLLIEKDAVEIYLLALQMGTSVEMIRKHYGHVNILKAAGHLKADNARQLFKGLGEMNEIYRSKLMP